VFTSALTGWVVTAGATPVPPPTFKVAALLVALPALLLTTTLNNVPLSERAVAGVAYDAAFAPLIEIPLFCHW
jgi:hypothetical protein